MRSPKGRLGADHLSSSSIGLCITARGQYGMSSLSNPVLEARIQHAAELLAPLIYDTCEDAHEGRQALQKSAAARILAA